MEDTLAQTVLLSSPGFRTPRSYRIRLVAPTLDAMKKTHAELVGERIAQAREKRKQAGMPATQEWLAEAVGVGQRAISNYENGEREPDLETLAKLADALECDPVWLGGMDKVQSRSRREEALLEIFRATDSRGQDIIMRIAEAQPDYVVPGDKKKKKSG